jgi:hypothetical protein
MVMMMMIIIIIIIIIMYRNYAQMRACYAPWTVLHTTQSQKNVSNAKAVPTTSMPVGVVVGKEILNSSLR